MFERAKEIVRCRNAPIIERALKCRPLSSERRERSQAALRMVERTGAAQPPQFRGQDQSLESVPVRPPIVPQLADIFSCRSCIKIEIGRLKKTGDTEEERFAMIDILAQRFQRQTL